MHTVSIINIDGYNTYLIVSPPVRGRVLVTVLDVESLLWSCQSTGTPDVRTGSAGRIDAHQSAGGREVMTDVAADLERRRRRGWRRG